MSQAAPLPQPPALPATRTGVAGWVPGILLVTGMAIVALLLATKMSGRQARQTQPVEFVGKAIAPFQLVERSGQPVSERDLRDVPWVAACFFSRCSGPCPRLSGTMARIQAELAGTTVRLVSISVDPQHDRPDVLARYAEAYGADPARWWFLTGDETAVGTLVRGSLALSWQPTQEAGVAPGEAVTHSTRLVLVAPGNRIASYHDSLDDKDVAEMVQRARRLVQPQP